jgi:hypothetical protein
MEPPGRPLPVHQGKLLCAYDASACALAAARANARPYFSSLSLARARARTSGSTRERKAFSRPYALKPFRPKGL